jgi:hypothetical protein
LVVARPRLATGLAIGQVTFYVPLAVIGKPLPGKSLAERWSSASA